MSIALATLADGAAAAEGNWFTVALAALNVAQTIALAYLAANARRGNGR